MKLRMTFLLALQLLCSALWAADPAAANRLLEQNETWADRAEWEVSKSPGVWEVLAWRIEHPERKGTVRYSPWGYSVIVFDSRLVTIHNRRKG